MWLKYSTHFIGLLWKVKDYAYIGFSRWLAYSNRLINVNFHCDLQASVLSSLKWVHGRVTWDGWCKIPDSCMSLVISSGVYNILVISYNSHGCALGEQEPWLFSQDQLWNGQGPGQNENMGLLFKSYQEFQDGNSRVFNQVWSLLSTGIVAHPRGWPCPFSMYSPCF